MMSMPQSVEIWEFWFQKYGAIAEAQSLLRGRVLFCDWIKPFLEDE